LPPLYALVHPGLEPVAADEITKDLGGEVRKIGRGLVVFRLPRIDERVLGLQTVEDVFLYAWGTDSLTYRAADLDNIEQWTGRNADWPRLLKFHHDVRPKPKGKPSYHLVTQMTGEHGYRRIDARKRFIRGLAGKFPESWRLVEEDAAVEFWLSIQGRQAVCGLRLSDAQMRHRTYKHEHLPASLRPSLAAAMVRLVGASAGQVLLDPLCGAGTILAEQAERDRPRGRGFVELWGGDRDPTAVRAASANLKRARPAVLARWDARQLPLASGSVDRIATNPPFGKQLSSPEEIGPLYRRLAPEWDRVLKPDGRAVVLVSDIEALRGAVRPLGWQSVRELRVRVLGQPAALTVWRKPAG
jgi:23S rRNA G2445 N2-methylase RlmL